MNLTKEILEKEIEALQAEADGHIARVNQLIGAKIHCQKLLSILGEAEVKATAAEDIQDAST